MYGIFEIGRAWKPLDVALERKPPDDSKMAAASTEFQIGNAMN